LQVGDGILDDERLEGAAEVLRIWRIAVAEAAPDSGRVLSFHGMSALCQERTPSLLRDSRAIQSPKTSGNSAEAPSMAPVSR
jgi:hypothetical protein